LLTSSLEVNMIRFRLILATALVAIAGAAAAQSGDTGRGSTPPGTSRDGAAPGDGAITGGSIAPGERSGVPSGSSNTGREQTLKRCNELDGILREQCLADAERAGAGRTVPPSKAPADGSQTEPRVAPPPQNPR
jgi:hypothetical protein